MVLKNSVYYIIGSLYPSILAFLIVPLLTHVLSTSEYGILTYIGAIIMFLSTFYSLGFNTYIFKAYSIKKYSLENFRLFHTLFWSLFILTIGVSIGVYFLLSNFKISSQLDITPYIIFIIATVFLTAQTIVPMSYLRIIEKAKEFFFFNVFFTSMEYISIFVFVITLQYGVEGKLFSKIVGLIFFVIILIFYFRKILFRNYYKKDYLIEALKFGPSFAFGGFMFILIDISDRFILERFVSMNDLGLYGVSYSLAFVLMAINRGVTKALQPHIIKITKENDEKKLFNTLNNASRFISIITFSTTILFLLSIEILIRFTFDQSYYKAVEYILFLSIVPMFYAHYNIYSSVLIALGKKSFFLKATFIGLLVNIGLNLLLIPYMGVYGAILATIGAYILMLLVTKFDFKESINIRIKDNSIFVFSALLIITIFSLFNNFFESILIQVLSTSVILLTLIKYIYFNLNIRTRNDLANLLQ